MGLDIRVPMGVMFGILGVIIAVYGVASSPEIYKQHSLGINVNLWWGLVMIAFSLAMLGLAWRKRTLDRSQRPH